MKPNAEIMKQAIGEAFYEWVAQHDVTTTYAMQDGVKEAVTDWLKVHGSAAIADAVRGAVADAPRELDLTDIGAVSE